MVEGALGGALAHSLRRGAPICMRELCGVCALLRGSFSEETKGACSGRTIC
jgi:hypothetical protein